MSEVIVPQMPVFHMGDFIHYSLQWLAVSPSVVLLAVVIAVVVGWLALVRRLDALEEARYEDVRSYMRRELAAMEAQTREDERIHRLVRGGKTEVR